MYRHWRQFEAFSPLCEKSQQQRERNMKFFTLLKSGVPVKEVTETFVLASVAINNDTSQTFAKFMTQFAEECLSAVGFNCSIEPDRIEEEEGINFLEDLETYTYIYNMADLALLEIFLIELCAEYHKKQHEYIDTMEEDGMFANGPIGVYIQIIVMWVNVCKSIRQQDKKLNFEQPIANINLFLLMGTHIMRKVYCDELPVLNTLCNRLYQYAIHGIRHLSTYTQLVKRLLSLFEEDYPFFYAESKQSLNIFYEILCTDYKHHDAYIMTFNTLIKSLSAQNDHLHILKAALVNSDMIDVYFTHLQNKRSNKLLLTILEFIDVLQSKLEDLDCFNLGFLDSILLLVMSKRKQVDKKAARLFMKMMMRKFNAFEIMKHLVSFYFGVTTNLDQLSHFVAILFPCMTREMQKPEIFIEMYNFKTGEDKYDKCLKIMHSNFYVEFLKHFLTDFETHQHTIKKMLKEVPDFLETEDCIFAKGVLLKIYTILNREQMAAIHELKTLEHFALTEFITCKNATHPYINNVLMLLVKCLSCSNNWNSLYNLATCSELEFFESEKNLSQQETQKNVPTNEDILQYRDNLMKMSLMMQVDLGSFTEVKKIFMVLTFRLYGKNQILEYAYRTNTFLDVYVYEVLIQCIIYLINDIRVSSKWLKEEAFKLMKYLINYLRDTAEMDKYHFLRRKTIFTCICTLCCKYILPKGFKLPYNVYDHLVENLIDLVMKRKGIHKKNAMIDSVEECQPTESRIREYQEQVLESFINLHKEIPEIPSPLTWKVIILYGKPSNTFDNEFVELLNVLVDKHFRVYRKCLATAIFNMCQTCQSREITRCIKAHNDFIEEKFDVKMADLLKISTVIQNFQLLRKVMMRQSTNTSRNRLEIFKHLHLFVKDFHLLSKQVMDIIMENLRPLSRYPLTSSESQSLSTFLEDLNKKKDST